MTIITIIISSSSSSIVLVDADALEVPGAGLRGEAALVL